MTYFQKLFRLLWIWYNLLYQFSFGCHFKFIHFCEIGWKPSTSSCLNKMNTSGFHFLFDQTVSLVIQHSDWLFLFIVQRFRFPLVAKWRHISKEKKTIIFDLLEDIYNPMNAPKRFDVYNELFLAHEKLQTEVAILLCVLDLWCCQSFAIAVCLQVCKFVY